MRAKASTRKGRSEEEEARGNVREGRTTRRTHQVTQDEEVHTPETPAPTQHSQNTPKTSEGAKGRNDATKQRRYRSRTLPSAAPADSDSSSPNVGGAFITPRLLFNRGAKRSQEEAPSSQSVSKKTRASSNTSVVKSPEKVPETPQIARGRSLSSAVRSLDWNKKDAEDEHKIFSVPANKFYGVPKAEDLKDTAFLVEIDGVFLRNEIYREILEQGEELARQRAKVEALHAKISSLKNGKSKAKKLKTMLAAVRLQENRLMVTEEKMETLDMIKSTIYITPGEKAVQLTPSSVVAGLGDFPAVSAKCLIPRVFHERKLNESDTRHQQQIYNSQVLERDYQGGSWMLQKVDVPKPVVLSQA